MKLFCYLQSLPKVLKYFQDKDGEIQIDTEFWVLIVNILSALSYDYPWRNLDITYFVELRPGTNTLSTVEAYLGPCQTYVEKNFAKIVSGFKAHLAGRKCIKILYQLTI